MVESQKKPDQKKLAEVKRHYLLPFDLVLIESEIKHATEGKPEYIAGPAKAFLENINAAITTVTIPYTLAKTSVLSTLFHQLVSRHRILVASDSLTIESMDREATPEEAANQSKVARQQASAEFHNRLNDQLERVQLFEESCDFLLDVLQDKNMQTAAQELLRQAVVMIWGPFEVLCRDLFVGHLNNNPGEAEKLMLDCETKKIYQAKAIDTEVLSSYGYNVSKNLGDIFASVSDLSSLGSIRQTFSILLPCEHSLHTLLRDKKLWVLQQRRHLTVHKRAIVDKQYLEKTGEKFQVGQRLTSTPTEVEEYLKVVCDSSLALVQAIAKS